MPINARISGAASLTAFMLVACSGCSRSVEICTASGKVLVNGRPADGAYIVFHAVDDPERERSPDTARTEKDGSFSARVRGAGEYAVTVFWPSVIEEQGEVIEGEDYFKGKYRNPVQRLTISEGENALPPIVLTYP